MNTLSVVVPNWNGKGLIEDCLESLLRQSFDDFKIIVVDNGSTDGSLEIIKSKFPQAKIIELKKMWALRELLMRA